MLVNAANRSVADTSSFYENCFMLIKVNTHSPIMYTLLLLQSNFFSHFYCIKLSTILTIFINGLYFYDFRLNISIFALI